MNGHGRTMLKTSPPSSGSETGILHVPSAILVSQIESLHHSNELNAAYAADGYARVNEHSIGVLTTTYGFYPFPTQIYILNRMLGSGSES
jgi:hypothetical protein